MQGGVDHPIDREQHDGQEEDGKCRVAPVLASRWFWDGTPECGGAFSTVVMLSSLVHCASAGPQVQDCEDQGDDHQHVAQGRTFTELEFVEGEVVGLRRDGLVELAGPPLVRPRMMSSTLSV